MSIEIWGKQLCTFCDRAKLVCDNRGFKYVYKELDTDFTREQVLEEFPGARTFPQIKVNGDIVGSYQQFEEYLENTGYNGTGHGH
tara:strand:- start:4006 stop:4260 length:255 start_codon:yes stop_codon:yes gene_type:complete